MSLVKKLAEVMEAVERIPKRGRNTFHNYDYATEADIVAAVRSELAKRHVMLLPEVVSCDFRELQPNKDGKPRDPLTVLHMTFTFLDGESDEVIAKPWIGIGQDGGDKGVYKAMTGGEKYFLMKTFLMPTGDDPEREDKAQIRERDRSTVKPDKETRKARVMPPEAKAAGAVYVEKVIPKTSGNKEWAEIVLSSGETVIGREPGCISLAVNLAQEATPVVVTTSRNGKGNVQLDEIARWKPDIQRVELPPEREPAGVF